MNGLAEVLDQPRILVGILRSFVNQVWWLIQKDLHSSRALQSPPVGTPRVSMLGGSVRPVGLRKSEKFNNGS